MRDSEYFETSLVALLFSYATSAGTCFAIRGRRFEPCHFHHFSLRVLKLLLHRTVQREFFFRSERTRAAFFQLAEFERPDGHADEP